MKEKTKGIFNLLCISVLFIQWFFCDCSFVVLSIYFNILHQAILKGDIFVLEVHNNNFCSCNVCGHMFDFITGHQRICMYRKMSVILLILTGKHYMLYIGLILPQ